MRVREVVFMLGNKRAVPGGRFMRTNDVEREVLRMFGSRRADRRTHNQAICLLRYLMRCGKVKQRNGGYGRRDTEWRLTNSGAGYFRWLYGLYKKTGEI